MAQDRKKSLSRRLALWGLPPLFLAGFAGAVILADAASPPSQNRVALMAETGLGPMGAGVHVSGSGFAVAPNMVVTNAHVTMRCEEAQLPITVGGTGGWHVVMEDPSSELSLLAAAPNTSLPPLRLSAAPQLPHATPVAVLGYPLSDQGFDRLRASHGHIDRAALTVHRPELGRSISFFTTGPDGKEVDPSWADGVAYFGRKNESRLRWILEIDAPSGHGDSGGPVVDGNGNVVGVIFAGSPTGHEVSAVSLDDLRDFLLRADITPLFAPPADQDHPDWQQAIDHAAASVLRIGC